MRYLSLVPSFSNQLLWVGLVFAVSACASAPYFIHNVHTVVPGVVYRSAQLSPEKLSSLVEEKGVRTVLNLRGASPGEGWYDGEKAAATTAGIRHIDYELSSKREVPPRQAEELIRIMQEAPKPLLIHCWGGADRTGLASALYLYALAEKPVEHASSALSWRYHHLSFTSAGAMDRSFDKFIEARVATARAEPAKAVEPAHGGPAGVETRTAAP